MLPVEEVPGYRVLDQAGQGGFAVVYRAYQERLDRVVALKVLSVDRVDQRTLRRFQRELQLTGRLTGHPNVVTVFDTGATRSGKPYIAMDFFDNGSLRDRVRKEGPLPVPEVLRTGVKLAGALAAVHEAGVLHGDIKPQNILISRYGEPAIADFGVARVVDSSEVSATSQAFTPLHAAPEVLTGHPHSASTDVYSLGSTLYHLLAGQPAFHNPADPSIAPLMYRVLSLEPPPVTRPDLPPAVLAIVLRAMAKQPESRHASARELALRLREAQAELGLPVTDLVGQDPPPAPAPPPRPHPIAPPPLSAAGPSGSRAPAVPAPPSVPGPTGSPARAVPAPPAGPYVTGARLPLLEGASGPEERAVSGETAPGEGARRAGPGGRGRTRGLLVGGVAGAVAVAVAGAAVAVHLALQRADGPEAGQPRTSQQPQAARQTPGPGRTGETAPPVTRRQIIAMTPRRLRVTADRGSLVELQWTLPAAARRYPVVLQRSPAEDGGPLTALGQGATRAKVAGLDAGTGYCFVVGVPLNIAEKSTVAWSKPACVRGATAG